MRKPASSRRKFAEQQRGMAPLYAGKQPSASDRAASRWIGSRPPRPTLGQFGVSGTPYTSNQNPYEENPALYGRQWPLTVRQMLLDPAVASNWAALKQTLLSASWRWESADESDPLCNFLRDFMADSWSGMAVPWEKQVGTIHEAFTVGYRYQEEQYEYRPAVGPDGVEREYVHLKRYHDREPVAHQQWLRDPDSGDLLAVTQATTYGRRQPEPIPASKLLLVTFNLTGQNYAGRGLFRSVWFYWNLKTQSATNLGIGVDRWGSNPVKVTVNREAAEDEASYSQTTVDELRDAAIEEARYFVAAEQSYVVDSTAVQIDAMDLGNTAATGAAMIDTVRMCDQQIAAAFFTQFLQLGITDAGSRGVSETMETFFRRAAVNMLDEVADSINGSPRPGGGTVGRLIEWNFGAVPADKLPRLVHDGLKTDPLAENFAALPALVQQGIVANSRALQDKAHDILGIPEPTDEEREAAEIAATTATPLAFMERARRRKEREA